MEMDPIYESTLYDFSGDLAIPLATIALRILLEHLPSFWNLVGLHISGPS